MDEEGTEVMDTGVKGAFDGMEILRTGANCGGSMECTVWTERESDDRWLEVPRREVRVWRDASASVEPQGSRDSGEVGSRVAWML